MTGDVLGLSTGRLLRNTVARSAGSTVMLVAGAVTGLLVARHLGPTSYGTFAFVWAVAWAVVTVVPLGFDSLLVRELNRRPQLLGLRRALPVVTAFGLAVAVALVAVSLVFASERSVALALGAGALYVALSGPLALVRAVFDADERMGLTAATDVIEAIAGLGAVLWLIALDAGLVALSVGVAGARAITLVVATVVLWNVRDAEPPPPMTPMPQLLSSSLPMAGSRAVSELLRRIDVLVLGVFVAPREVGWYVAAAAVAMYAPVVLKELNRALYPILSRASSPEDRHLVRIFTLTWRVHLLLGTVAAAGLAVLAEPLVTLLYGGAYAPAGALLSILAFTIPLRLTGALCAITLDATYRQAERLRASGFALALGLVLNGALIPLFGVWGAAVATVLGELAFLVAVLRALRPHRPPLLVPLAWSVLCSLPVAAAAWLTPGSSIVRMLSGAGTFAVIAALALARARPDGDEDHMTGELVRGYQTFRRQRSR